MLYSKVLSTYDFSAYFLNFLILKIFIFNYRYNKIKIDFTLFYFNKKLCFSKVNLNYVFYIRIELKSLSNYSVMKKKVYNDSFSFTVIS